jgi:hypothetical protein
MRLDTLPSPRSRSAAAVVHVAPSSANDADSIVRAPTTKCEPVGEFVLSPEEREKVGRGGSQEDGENSGSAAGSLRQSSPESTKTIGRAEAAKRSGHDARIL